MYVEHNLLEPAAEGIKCVRRRNILPIVKSKLPIIGWIEKYNWTCLYYDFISGVTVGLVVIPQCLAFGALAGLPPLYGLFSAFLCPFIYGVFGSSKDLTISPVAILSVIVSQYTLHSTEQENIIYASSLAFLSGIVLIAMGLLNLGVLVSFVSMPVLNGYASCVALVVIFSMLKEVFGLTLPRGNTIQNIGNFFKHIPKTKPADVILGLLCIATFLALKKLSEWNANQRITPNSNRNRRILSKVIWFICTTRFFLVLLTVTFISQILVDVFKIKQIFTVVGTMEQGLPKPYVPILSYKNQHNITVSTSDIISNIGSGCFTIALVAVLNTLAAVKTVGNLNNYRVNMSQEILALGIITFAGSFFRGFPVAGSLSRSLLNSECGVRTPLNGFFAGSVVIVSLTVLTPWFKYIPKAGLAALVIAALFPMIDSTMIRTLWKSKRIELIPLLASFCTVLYNPVTGLLVGIGTHLILFLYYNAILKLDVEDTEDAIIVHLGMKNILYASVEQLISKIEETLILHKEKDLVIDFSQVSMVDVTVAMALKKVFEVKKGTNVKQQDIFLINVSENVFSMLKKFDYDNSLINTWSLPGLRGSSEVIEFSFHETTL